MSQTLPLVADARTPNHLSALLRRLRCAVANIGAHRDLMYRSDRSLADIGLRRGEILQRDLGRTYHSEIA